MVQRGGVLGLAAEPLLELRVARQVGTQDLDGHLAAPSHVVGVVDLGPAAVAERVAKLVAVGEHSRCAHCSVPSHFVHGVPVMPSACSSCPCLSPCPCPYLLSPLS